ncbi:hypothetical protein PHYBLDRAFT_148290 [Phycomyces blakesleeanus NRRL 1555(-)]|uniref:Uncharacterized protein n=1 Tax=Phycomyces blakesleeanus (strain ATCC 8743b / DSM 1359 / FGSC 10004 / NBRC 33097 / NRRL 1555) TaxID=763407 RepID=A0A162TUD2_PHYB8|nr:hypothetical protein PHYBLDRAFT_148290 [Phycomyces blakesleeanus NRRL 1555(-)]OAD71072.1 hypothetical protein PHYBLDRAFT_148290 [Phycomyces blakesleeanus NRRL 1555(-)]|eukprot:XP_018289112.1 hypothetical protein PHYBLDRAFT_148290 [Phycomyces blakesleeanus NRRL 1555(-)]
MLTLNIDWFQPFNGVTYSCGAIYLSINNLPREERYKKENVILAGLMPGPKEAKTRACVCTALFLVACDIPAAHKTCGFILHTSVNACHICNCKFTRLPNNRDMHYLGFVFSDWVARTEQENQ